MNVSASVPLQGLERVSANASVSGNDHAYAHSETGISVPPRANDRGRARRSGHLPNASGNESGHRAHGCGYGCGRARRVEGLAERLDHDYARDYARASANASGRPVKEGSGTCASGRERSGRSTYVVMAAHSEHAEEVDGKTERTDQEELAGVHLWRIEPRAK